jgi:hypothetical protein
MLDSSQVFSNNGLRDASTITSAGGLNTFSKRRAVARHITAVVWRFSSDRHCGVWSKITAAVLEFEFSDSERCSTSAHCGATIRLRDATLGTYRLLLSDSVQFAELTAWRRTCEADILACGSIFSLLRHRVIPALAH